MDSKPFKIGINMAGAISAGAYTAGVLDFLIEALDEWYAAKKNWKADPAKAPAVPLHDVSIEVFSGASAGGMCAAIAAAQVQQEFEHISDPSKSNTSNLLYESWVNRIDIFQLLSTDDLRSDQPVVSLLDSTVIDKIARRAFQNPGLPKRREYISPHLTLFLTLTNLRGIPYSLNGVAPGSEEETICYYGDRMQFETVQPGAPPVERWAKPLPISGQPDGGAWPGLQMAAKATGSFPIFLAPRELKRDVDDYALPMWPTCQQPNGPAPT